MRRIASVAIVLAGLICLAFTPSLLGRFATGFEAFTYGEPYPLLTLVLNGLPAIAAVLLGLYLIYNRHYWASRLFEDDDESAGPAPADLMRLVVLGLGLWLLASAFTTAVAIIVTQFQMFAANVSEEAGFPPVAIYWLDLVKVLAFVAAGWFLIARSQQVSRWLWQDAGREVAMSPEGMLPKCPSCGSPYDPHDYEAHVEVITCEACGERVDIVRG